MNTKYIEIDCHFPRDAVVQRFIVPRHVSTHVQLDDIFTKSLGKKQFDSLILFFASWTLTILMLQLEGGINVSYPILSYTVLIVLGN